MRVAIIGGGVIGLYTASFLTHQGAEVTIFEKSTPGAGSTGRSGGGIGSQFSSEVNVRLSALSREYWDSFESKYETDIHRRRVGNLLLAREEETASQLREDVAMQNRHGVPSEFIDPTEAADLCPAIYTDKYVGAAYSGCDEFVDTDLVKMALVSDLESRGVAIRRQTKVTDVVIENGSIAGIRTQKGRVDTDVVVNAAGPWARQAASMAGIDLPIKPELHRVAFARPDPPISESIPFTMDVDTGSMFRPKDDDTVVISGRQEYQRCDPDSFPRNAPLEWTSEVLEAVANMSSSFDSDTEVCNTLSGLYAMTPDGIPIIEESIPGFVNAVGFSGHGFMHAPAAGKLVSEIVYDEPPSIDIRPLRHEQFYETQFSRKQSVI